MESWEAAQLRRAWALSDGEVDRDELGRALVTLEMLFNERAAMEALLLRLVGVPMSLRVWRTVKGLREQLGL